MISYNDQMSFFRLVSQNLEKPVECYCFGGTAMMFYGYKDETKDIDLFFQKPAARDEFIRAIVKLGFEETSPFKVYIPEKLRDKSRPLMFKRDDFRLDLFVGKIFRTVLSPKMKEDIFALHEFGQERSLKVKVLRKEHIVLLKAVTERKNDFDDILNIISMEKGFDWDYIIDEAVWQHKNGDTWSLLDLEKAMTGLKDYSLIPERHFNKICKALEAGN